MGVHQIGGVARGPQRRAQGLGRESVPVAVVDFPRRATGLLPGGLTKLVTSFIEPGDTHQKGIFSVAPQAQCCVVTVE